MVDRYGKADLPQGDSDFDVALRKYFHVYQQIQDATGPVHGCGSYLHGGWSKNYAPEFYEKQKSLFHLVTNKKTVLEIGVFRACSLLLMLMSNPDLRIVAIDICESPDTRRAVDIVNRHFGFRVVLLEGSSYTRIFDVIGQQFDMIHVDACHDFMPCFHDLLVSSILGSGKLLVVDDMDNEGVSKAYNLLAKHLRLNNTPTLTSHVHNMGHLVLPQPSNTPALIVTCLYDLNRQDGFVDRALLGGEWYRRLDAPMIIFTESKFVPYLQDLRRDFLDKTWIRVLSLSETCFWADMERVRQNMTLYHIRNQSPSKDTIETALLYSCKFDFLDRAMQEFPSYKRVVWMDFGISKNVANPEFFNVFAHRITEQISHCVVEPYFAPASPKTFFTWFYHHIAGSFFGGSPDNMKWYIAEYKRLWNQILSEGWYQHDEALMTMIVEASPHMFRLYYGDYNALFSNYEFCFTDQHRIINMVHKCLDNQGYAKANAIVDYLKPTCLHDHQYRVMFLKVCILSRFYHNDSTLDPEFRVSLQSDWAADLRKQEQHNLAWYRDLQ